MTRLSATRLPAPRALLCSAAVLALAACSPTPPAMKTDAPAPPAAVERTVSQPPMGAVRRSEVPHAQLPTTVTPTAYRIDMTIDPQSDGMSGRVEIDATVNESTDGFWIHAKDMEVTDAVFTLEGADYPLTFDAVPEAEAPSGLAWMAAGRTLPAGSGTLRMDYTTPFNRNLNSAYKVVRGDDAYVVTQMEPLGAREAFPGFDEPRFKQPFQLSITAPDGNVVVSNTPKVEELPLDGGMIRHQFAQTRPLPTYLVAFAVGPYDVVDAGELPPNAVRERPLDFRGIAARGEGARLDYALENTDGLLTALEEYFGTPYPYEKLDLIAAPDYAFGAMENPGLIVYREYLLLLDDNAPLSQQRAYASVHSHELAHQWFGNLVTPVWWEDIWLNEAFATWMGNKGLTLWRPDGGFDNNTLRASLGAMNTDTLASTRAVREPLRRSERVMDQFDGITYRKGGGVLDMFESYVGEDAFQAGIRLHMERYADGVATADDFFQSIADGSGNPDVVSAMKSFVDQPGLPLVSVSETTPTADDGNTWLVLSQRRYAPLGSTVQQGQSWEIPVCVAYGLADGRDRSCTLLKEGNDPVVRVPGDATWVMPNADGAGYYRFTLDAAGWDALIGNLDALNTKEALSAQDSLVAAFRAGEVDADTFLSGMQAFARHPEYDVASGSTRLLGFVYDEFPDARPGLARYVRDTYGERYRATVGTDTVEGQLLAPGLGSMLATMGEDEDVRATLLEQGRIYLGLSEGDRASVPSNQLGSSLAQVMRAQPEAAFEPLLALATTGSPLEKGAALSALTQTPREDQAERLLALSLAEDSPLTGNQTGSVIAGLLGNEAHSDRTWDWYTANFDAYMAAKVPDVRRGRAPLAAGGFCSDARRAEAADFFRSKAGIIPGYERSLAQVEERIALCAALKEAQGASLARALEG